MLVDQHSLQVRIVKKKNELSSVVATAVQSSR